MAAGRFRAPKRARPLQNRQRNAHGSLEPIVEPVLRRSRRGLVNQGKNQQKSVRKAWRALGNSLRTPTLCGCRVSFELADKHARRALSR